MTHKMRKTVFVLTMVLAGGAFLGAQAADRFEPNDSAERAFALSGTQERLDGLMMDEEDLDWFRFTVSRAQGISIETEGDLDMLLSIHGPDSQEEVFAFDDDSGDDLNAKVSAYFVPGTYYIKVGGYHDGDGSATGSYALVISPFDLSPDSSEPNDNRREAKSLDTASLPKTFSLLPQRVSADEDWFILRLSSFRYRENEGLTVYTSGELDTRIEIYLGDELIAENDDFSEDDYNARVTFIPRQDRGGENYYLLVSGYDLSVVGEYSLHAETASLNFDSYEPNNSKAQATRLVPGRPLEGNTLSGYDTEDWFVLSFVSPLRENEGLTVYTSGELDTYIELYLGNELIAENDDGSEGDYNARIAFLPRQNSGGADYYLVVSGYDLSVAGEYSLHAETESVEFDAYEPNNSKGQATRLSLGRPLGGNSFSAFDMEDWFSFTLTQRGNFTLGTEGDMDTVIELFNESGDSIVGDDDSGREYNALLVLDTDLAPGTYYVKVWHYEGVGQEYSIFINQE